MIKNLFLAVFSITVLCAGCDSGKEDDNESIPGDLQIALYDENKEAIAYIDYGDDTTIYTFEGEPVAYIQSEEQVYGFNGKFLGWYWEGALYDRGYYVVGAKHGIVRGGINTAVTRPEKVKGNKKVKPVQSVRENAFARPVLKDSWSETALTEFFSGGKK